MVGFNFLRSLICLSLVLLLIQNLFLVHVSSVTNNDNYNDRSNSPRDKLDNNIEKESNERDLSSNNDASSLSEDVPNVLDDDEDNEDGNDGATTGKNFSWQHHPDDHGVYSGRSLISTEGIAEHANKVNEDDEEDDVDVVEELDNKLAGKSGSSSSERKRKTKKYDADHPDPLVTIDFAEREWQLMFRSYDLAYDSASSSILEELGRQTNLFDNIISRVKPQCRRDIYYVRDSVKKHKLWALRMLDSNGKLPSGVTYGRFSSPGDYEECLAVQVDDKLYKDVARNITEKYKFHGKYCLLDFRLPLPERSADKLLSIHESVLDFNNTEIGKLYPEMIGKYSSYASVFYEIGYLHAFCLPSSCDVNDLARAMTKALEGTYLIVNNTIDCEERPIDQVEPLRTSQIISLVLMAALFANAFIASLAHYLMNKKDTKQQQQQQQRRRRKSSAGNNQRSHKKDDHGKGEKERQLNEDMAENNNKGGASNAKESLWESIQRSTLRNKFYSDCFSVQKNFERLTTSDPRGLTFVHYTRIVAMALTVITHTGALGTLQAITKPADASNSEQIFRDLIPQMLANAFTSIQIFFFMAGFMLVISTYPSIARDKGHISFLEYAIKRAIRLMPGIAATICVNFLWPLLVDGPMLKYFTRIIMIPCETNWWHTLGFVSNFDHVEKMCLRHSYFSASDYQLHIIAFPILILLYKQPGLALSLAGLLTVSGFVAQIIMILTKTVLPFMMVDYIDKQAFFNVVHYIHHPVWNHMSAFFYGFIVGYAVVKQIRINISQKTIKRLWYILVPAGIVSIFAPYFWNHYKRPIHKWQMILYVIFDRFTLLTTCAWLSYASMVLARPKKPQAQQKPIENLTPSDAELAAKKSGVTIAAFDHPKNYGAEAEDATNQRLRPSNGSLASLPRQRSSPNLAYLQQQQHQQQQQQTDPMNNLGSPRRLSKAISSSNLETIAETSGGNKSQLQGPLDGQQMVSTGQPDERPPTQTVGQQQQQQRKRPQAPVSNMNTLCLMLSRLTFQLYLFNMVVLWIDVNHSKYYWFFSYYFIVFKAAAVYICSALLAMVFFITLESPSLTLYIAWVKGRAAARAKQLAARAAAVSANAGHSKQPGVLNKLSGGGGMVPIESIATSSPGLDGGKATEKPTFSFIDLSSSPTNSEPAPLGSYDGKNKSSQGGVLDQTRM